MITKWILTHATAKNHDPVTRVTTRTVNLVEITAPTVGPRQNQWRERMFAEIKIVSHINDVSVRVLFSHTGGSTEWHARAEAARLYAQLADTRGDFEQTKDEPLEIELAVDSLDRRNVEVTGPDALTCVACFFGDEIAEVLL